MGIHLPACKISKQLDIFKHFDQITLLYLNGGVYNYIITIHTYSYKYSSDSLIIAKILLG